MMRLSATWGWLVFSVHGSQLRYAGYSLLPVLIEKLWHVIVRARICVHA